jgi:hypothetical protein
MVRAILFAPWQAFLACLRRERLSGRILSAHQQACVLVMKRLACSWTPMQPQLSAPYLLPAGLAGGWRSAEAGGGPGGIDSAGGAFPTVLWTK